MPDKSAAIDSASGAATGAGQAGGLGLGERLRSARKARALSLERVAEGLHLDESAVLALEEERFDELGAPVFVRGHLKAYAKLVDLVPETVLDAYRELEPQNPVVPAVERDVKRQVTVNPVLWGFSGLVLLLVVVLALYVLQDDAEAPLTTATTEEAAALPVDGEDSVKSAQSFSDPLEATASPVTNPEPESPPAQPAVPAVVASAPPVPAPLPVTETAEVARPSAELVRLSLQFREESWVEISDANQRLLFGLQREGRHRDLAGEPPFRFLIGNAAGVDLRINDEPYAVPPADITGKVARFEISAAAIE